VKWTKQPGTSEGVTYQEPPYDGPYTNPPYDPNVFAIQSNPGSGVKWCNVCKRPVVLGDQPPHPHFDNEVNVELGP
jgi:hypothetical protein